MSIPYTVSVAHPDYKRPYCSIEYGVGENLDDVRERIVNSFLEVLNSYETYSWIACDDYAKFWKEVYTDSYMEQLPIDYQLYDIEKAEWSKIWTNEELYFDAYKRYMSDIEDDSGDEDYCKEHNRVLVDMRKKYGLKKPEAE